MRPSLEGVAVLSPTSTVGDFAKAEQRLGQGLRVQSSAA
jgi:hypothetical protein